MASFLATWKQQVMQEEWEGRFQTERLQEECELE